MRRGGELLELPAEQLVPGDIVLLEAGDRVPADGRMINAATLEIDESALTGESAPVPKEIAPVSKVDTPLGDRVDMAYMNTNVTRGAGEILVTATGMSTEVGHISGLLQTTEIEETPLTKQLNTLTKQIVIIAVVALFRLLAIGYFRNGQTLDSLFLTGVAFAIAAIPTGLPAVVTYLLATGTTALAAGRSHRQAAALGGDAGRDLGHQLGQDRHADAQPDDGRRDGDLSASATPSPAAATARTGRSRASAACPTADLEPYLLPMALASDAVAKDGALVGDPTEGALVVLAAKGGIDATTTREEYPARRDAAVRRGLQAHGDLPSHEG